MTQVDIRVRYAETDRMGVAWHGHYLSWFEIGRTAWMREAGCPYGELEEKRGIFFPVIRACARYRASARYDERIRVKTALVKMSGARVQFDYEVVRAETNQLLATGSTEHGAIGSNGRPVRLPQDLRDRLMEYGAAS